MKRSIIAVLLALSVLLLPQRVQAQDEGQMLIIPAGQRYEGDLASVAEHIQVDGEVTGDVTSWSGNIVIRGQVGGDVVSYAGTVTIGPQARITGHVMALGEQVQVEQGASIAGQLFEGGNSVGALASMLDLLAPASPAETEPLIGRGLFGIALGVLLLGFSLLCVAFWPRRTAVSSSTLQQLPGRALALGLGVTVMLALSVLPIAAVLAASLIGFPLLLVVVLLVQIPYVYGLATLIQLAGARVRRSAQPADVTTVTALVGLGLAVLIALSAAWSPLFGLVLFYLVASPGLGAAILSRGGLMAPLEVRV